MSAPRTSFSFIEQRLLYELDRDLARIPDDLVRREPESFSILGLAFHPTGQGGHRSEAASCQEG
jgi:hypothetical protein